MDRVYKRQYYILCNVREHSLELILRNVYTNCFRKHAEGFIGLVCLGFFSLNLTGREIFIEFSDGNGILASKQRLSS